MSSTSISSAVLPGALALGGADGEGRAAAARTRSADPAASSSANSLLALPWLAQALGGGSTSGAGWLASVSGARASGSTGYAQAATSKSTSGTTPKATGEWSFLSDASLTIEDKLAMFMQAVQKKIDDELTQKMDDYKAKYGDGGSESTKKDDGSGFFGNILGAIFPGLSSIGDLFGGLEGFLGDALKSLGGPMLAALATAVGAPMLAPAALKIGDALGSLLGGSATKSTKTTAKGGGTKTPDDVKAEAKASTAKTSSSSKSTSSSTSKSSKTKSTSSDTGEAGSPDERLAMLEIQRLVDKQNELFSLVSNLLKGMHDTGMTAVQNLR